jgi:hypothetical protein
VGSGHSINERGVSSQLENGPSTVTVANGANFRVLGLERLGNGFDLGISLVLAVTANEFRNRESSAFFWVMEGIGVDNFTSEADREG